MPSTVGEGLDMRQIDPGRAGLLFAVLGAATLSSCGGNSADGTKLIAPTAAAQRVPCTDYLETSVPDEVAARVECFTLSVAQDPDHPNAALATVSIAFSVLTPRGPVAPSEPLLVLAGGIGIEVARQGFGRRLTPDKLELLGSGRQVVLMDHRGAGLSQPLLQCADVSDAEPTPLLPTDAALAACKAQFAAAQIDMRFFTAVQAAQDAIAVRKALGITSWNVYGFSYGSTMALELLRRDAAAVRAVALDGVAPPEGSGFSQEYRLGNFIDTIAACEADPACGARYPDSLGTLATLLASLPNDPGFDPMSRADTALSRQRLVAALHSAVEFSDENGDDLRGRIPAAIAAMAAGDRSLVNALAAAFDLNWPIAEPPPPQGTALSFLSYVCTHEAGRQNDGIGLARHPRPVASIVNASAWTDFQNWPRLCAALGVGTGPELDTQTVVSDRPALLMNGERDGATPRVTSERAAKSLSRSRTILFPESGHVQTLQQYDCARNVISQFLARPDIAPDASCKDAAPKTVWTILP